VAFLSLEPGAKASSEDDSVCGEWDHFCCSWGGGWR
jgi:hypothetical protein